jgi:glycosyltransferase involved in cell wall biosynthesis
VSVVVLTYNEEENLRRCLESVRGWADKVFVIDGYSTDGTMEVAGAFGAEVLQTDLRKYGPIFNWGLAHADIRTDWTMRLDADETVTPRLRDLWLERRSGFPPAVTGVYVRRRIHFLGRWIRHGGCYPIWHLRLWRTGQATCEERLADEHIVLKSGRTVRLPADIVDDSTKALHWWVEKHNGYATRQAIEHVKARHGHATSSGIEASLLGSQEQRKRWISRNFYEHSPLFARALAYYLYRYFIRLGFLDGPEGIVWHFLQAFWYRFLVDAKIYEIERRMRTRGIDARRAVFEIHGVEL